MAKRTERPVFTLQEAARIAGYLGGDGHSILSIDFVDTMGGVPRSKVEFFNEVHKSDDSDGTGKHVINGDPKAVMRGVYTLTLLEAACRDCGADKYNEREYFGRGRRAQAACDAIKRLARESNVPVPRWDDEGKEVGIEFPLPGQICHPTDANAEPE